LPLGPCLPPMKEVKGLMCRYFPAIFVMSTNGKNLPQPLGAHETQL
jgi:hypothetical protein